MPHVRSVTTPGASSAAARTPRPLERRPSQRNRMPSKVRLRLTMQIEYGLRPALHMIARHADGPTAITLGVDKALRRRRLRQRAVLDGCEMSHRTPAAAALRLTGERPGTAAMPSARTLASGSSGHSAGSRQSRGKSRPLARRRDGGHSDFLDRVEQGRLTFQGKSDGESPFGALKDFPDLRYRSACAEFSSC
jgi:hypothetical protein